jgi:phytoene dehydrogenase-like protein
MYKKEKKRITERIITLLEEYCGPLRTTIEIIDTATPATYIRYTNTYKGSYQSWAPVPKLIGNSLDKKITDLDNFYMCGQWVEPAGGLTRAIVSARNVVQIICADNGKKFFV